jgi:hypothetical protein
MTKPGPTFKLEKQTKRYLALILDPHYRGEMKRQMIQAQMAGAVRVREKRKNEPDLE